MKKLILIASITILFSAKIFAQLPTERDTLAHNTDAYGNEFIEVQIPSIPMKYYVYKIKMNKENHIKVALANKHIPDTVRNLITNVAERENNAKYKTTAVINADFFSYKTGEIEGLQVTDGEIAYALTNIKKYGVYIDKRNRVEIDSVYFDGDMKVKSGSYPISGVNSLRLRNKTELNFFFNSTVNFKDFQPEKHVLVLLQKKGKKFKYLKTLNTTPNKLEDGEYMLAIAPNIAKNIVAEIEDKPFVINLDMKIVRSNNKIVASQLVSGGVPLVLGGKKVLNNNDGYRAGVHPRTAIGANTKKDMFVWVVVDGRQKFSKGANYAQLSEIFLENGCSAAVNLDGGGSSAMLLGGKVVNNPSDKTGARPCLNYLILSRKNSVKTNNRR